ncbi:hypothetical protein F6P95_17205 [Escherichia coli]|nr:hypothetical protein F6P95_17205 [Escherichia coli]
MALHNSRHVFSQSGILLFLTTKLTTSIWDRLLIQAITLHKHQAIGNDSNLLIVFYVQIMPDDFVMQLHRF